MGRSVQWIASALAADFSVVVGTPCVGEVKSVRVTSLLSFTKHFGGHLLFSVCLPFVLNRWIARHRIDFLVFPGGPGGVLLLRVPRIPFLSSPYHLYEQQARLVPGQWWKKIFIPLESRTYRHAAGVLCFNEDSRNILQRQYKIPAQRLHFVPHAIDLQAWIKRVSQKERGLCVCIARLEKRKGIDLLLRAWAEVIHRVPSARLVIVGRGILASKVDALVRCIPSVERIFSLSFPDLVALVQSAEVAVSSSYLEGFGLTIAEAMAAGTAVAAANSEGVRCLLEDQKTASLCRSGDAHALAESISSLLEQDTFREHLIRAAFKEAKKRFDPDAASQALRDAVHQILVDVTQRGERRRL